MFLLDSAKIRNRYLALSLVIIYLVLAFGTLVNTGVVWDETRYIAQSKAKAYSVFSNLFGKEDLFFCQINESFYGTEWEERCWEGRARTPLLTSGLIWGMVWFANGGQLDVLHSIAAHRVSTILFTSVGLFVLFIFIAEAYNRRAATLATLSLIFMPRFFAHSKYVLLDEPSAVMWIVTLWIFWKGLKDWRYGMLLGPVFAVACATKAMTYFIPVALAIWLLISYRDKIYQACVSRKPKLKREHWTLLASLFLLTLPFLILQWPWLWYDTLNRLLWEPSYYGFHLGTGGVSVYYLGQYMERAVWHQPFLTALSAIPTFILLFSFAGAWKAIKDTLSLSNRTSSLILISALLPIMVLGAIQVTYNGVQEFLPVFPFIAILSGIGCDWLLRSFSQKKHLPYLTVLVVLLIATPGLISFSEGHDDSYFNALFGGPLGVYNSGAFEVTWSGEAYLEAIRWLDKNAEQGSVLYVAMADQIFSNYLKGDIGLIAERLNDGGLDRSYFNQPPAFRQDMKVIGPRTGSPNESNYVVVLNRKAQLVEQSSFTYLPVKDFIERCDPVYSVKKAGAPLVVVYDTTCLQ